MLGFTPTYPRKGAQRGTAAEPEKTGGVLPRASQLSDIIKSIHSINEQHGHQSRQPLEDDIFIKTTVVALYHLLVRIYRTVFNRVYGDFVTQTVRKCFEYFVNSPMKPRAVRRIVDCDAAAHPTQKPTHQVACKRAHLILA